MVLSVRPNKNLNCVPLFIHCFYGPELVWKKYLATGVELEGEGGV